MIERAKFPKKTTLLKGNIKTNRMGRTKWTYHKERSVATNYVIFLKTEIEYKSLL